MEPFMLGYNLLLNSVGYGALPYAWSAAGRDSLFFAGRLGRYDSEEDPGAGTPRIWFHAVSVGEVTGAVPTLRALRKRLPGASIFLTSGTPQGFRFARTQLAADRAAVFPFPLDFPWCVKRAMAFIRPDLYATFESEFWPNLFKLLRERNLPALLLNGRLSDRSTGRYRLLRPLFQPIFAQFHHLAMHSDRDRFNAVSLGAAPERTLVSGSSKYDGLTARTRNADTSRWREVLSITGEAPVVVAGSLRRSECTELLRVFDALTRVEPQSIGIFAPRHLERIPEMVRWLRDRGIEHHLLSRIETGEEARDARVVLVDRIGILFDLYALGDLVFCGGTFEPIGGHNILEPSAWGKPVFYGPSLQKVFYEHSTLQRFGGSFPVQNPEDLLEQWKRWIQHLPELELHGRQAREALVSLGGAAAKHVDLIMQSLSGKELRSTVDHAED